MRVGYIFDLESGVKTNLDNKGCQRVWIETGTGKKQDRPVWDECLASLNSGDVLVIQRLDHIARSLIDLSQIIKQLRQRNIDLVSLGEELNTATDNNAFYQVFELLQSFEKGLIARRTRPGLESASRRGQKGGRPPAFSEDRAKSAYLMYKSGQPVARWVKNHNRKADKPSTSQSLYRAWKRYGCEYKEGGWVCPLWD